jgi:ABC-type multidrug transport system permease subunit
MKTNSTAYPFISVAAIIFVTLKLCNVGWFATASWWWIVVIIIGPLALAFGVLGLLTLLLKFLERKV